MIVIFYQTTAEGSVIVGRLGPNVVEGIGQSFADGYSYRGRRVKPTDADFWTLFPEAFDGRYLRAEVVESGAEKRLKVASYLSALLGKGGPGSGNWAHTSVTRRGHQGGSDPGGGHGAKGLFGVGVGNFMRDAAAQNGKMVQALSGGVAHAVELVAYESGGLGVWKEMEIAGGGGSGHNEIMAFELDRLLGLGVVPPTVVSGNGTSQMFVNGAETGVKHIAGDENMSWFNFQLNEQLQAAEKQLFQSVDGARIAALDILTGNVDRHSWNYLVKEGRLAAIDNGILGRNPGSAQRIGPSIVWKGKPIPSQVTKGWDKVTKESYVNTVRKGEPARWKDKVVEQSWATFEKMRTSGRFPES